MQSDVIQIVRLDPVPTIPDGAHRGYWTGYEVRVRIDGQAYQLQTSRSVRGNDMPCVVTSWNGVIEVRLGVGNLG